MLQVSEIEVENRLREDNPWWLSGGGIEPEWASMPRRAYLPAFSALIRSEGARRAVLLMGLRRVGKTILVYHAIHSLLQEGVTGRDILYVSLETPSLIGLSLDMLVWRFEKMFDRPAGTRLYVFFDEIQYLKSWELHLKSLVDSYRHCQFVATGSAAAALKHKSAESGAGRFTEFVLPPLTFFEFLRFVGKENDLIREEADAEGRRRFVATDIHALNTAFVDYLNFGGYPEAVFFEGLRKNPRRYIKSDIIDKVLKRDMTALFGVRRVLDLEHTFLYLCMHDGGLLDMVDLCANLEVKRPTAQNFIELLEATHLIYRLPPFGYGKDILRARFKIYLADAAIAPAVMLKGKAILEDPAALGVATETAVFKHLFARYYAQNVRFTYWRGKKDREVDLVAEVGGQIIPFEVKYRAQHTGLRDLKGLLELCRQKSIDRGYVVTKSLDDFGTIADLPDTATRILRIPAPLLCYWMGESELTPEQQ